MNDNCEWTEDSDGGWFMTSCGQSFIVNEGLPSENNMKFCCYCGKPIEEIPYKYEYDD